MKQAITDSHAWGLSVQSYTQPNTVGTTMVNIQFQLPTQLTKKRAYLWVLFALMSGAVGYQLALTRQPKISHAVSGQITKASFISEANATLALSDSVMMQTAKTQPNFALHLDHTLETAIDTRVVNGQMPDWSVASPAEASPKTKPIQLAKWTATSTTNDTSHADTADQTTNDAMPIALAEPSKAKQSVFEQAAKPMLEAKVSISKHMTADQQSVYYYQQAIAFLQQGRVAEAQDMLKKTLELYPANEDARQTLVGLLVDNHQHEEAMAVLKSGLALSPKHSSFTQTLARLQLDAGMTEDALATLQLGAIEQIQDAEYQGLLAVVQQRLNHHDEAVTHFQQALNQGANTPAWLIGMAVSLQMLGRNAEAKASFQQAQQLTLNPDLALFVAERIKQVQ
jgi:MSHA biogenesis protein MshN